VFILQLVYKVKSNDILEKLALISVDTSEQTKWQQLVDEAKENLHKIQVCFPSQEVEY
jgi:kinetochore-associated protein 1